MYRFVILQGRLLNEIEIIIWAKFTRFKNIMLSFLLSVDLSHNIQGHSFIDMFLEQLMKTLGDASPF